MTFAACPNCPGEIIVGSYSTITVPRVDEDGFPELGADGKLRYITLRLPNHRVRFVGQSADSAVDRDGNPLNRWGAQPDGPYSVFDPTGLSPAMCAHGLPEHPDGWRLRSGGQSWIRAKYLDVGLGGVTCPVCRGEPAPADLCTPRNAA